MNEIDHLHYLTYGWEDLCQHEIFYLEEVD